jgi:hypothetical protein
VLIQKLQHLFPAVVLLGAGLQGLMGEEPRPWGLALPVAQIAIGALMLGAVAETAYGTRHLWRRTSAAHAEHHAHPAIEWENFIAAAMILAEGVERRLHGGHHFPRPAIVMAVVLVVTGLLHGRVLSAAERRSTLRVEPDGIYVPGRRFRVRKIQAKWADLASIEIGDRRAVITTREGRVRRLDLFDRSRPRSAAGPRGSETAAGRPRACAYG